MDTTNVRQTNLTEYSNSGILKERRRFKATIVFEVYGEDDIDAQKRAETISRMIDMQHDNHCYLESLHENAFGALTMREVELEKK